MRTSTTHIRFCLLAVFALGVAACASPTEEVQAGAASSTLPPVAASPAEPDTNTPAESGTAEKEPEQPEVADVEEVVEPLPEVGLVDVVLELANGSVFGLDSEVEDASVIAKRASGTEDWVAVWQSPSDLVVSLDELEVDPAGGLVAVGAARPVGDLYDVLEQRRPVAYYSEDGVDWAEAPITGDFEGRGGVLNDVVWSSADDRFYAIGYDGVSSQSQRAILFSSETGAAWETVEMPFGATEFDEKGQVIAATDAGLVAIGSAEYAPEPFALIWIYDVDAGWSREEVDTAGSPFGLVNEYRECIEAGTISVDGGTVVCPAG